MSKSVQNGSNLVVTVAYGHSTGDLQRFHGCSHLGRGTRPFHLELSVRTSVPVNSELQSFILLFFVHDDLFYGRVKDHLLECRRTAIASPDFRKVLTHQTNSGFLFGRQRIALLVEAGKSLFDGRDLLQLFVPATLQFAGYQTIPGIHRVVLFKRFLGLVLELIEFARQGGPLCGISCALAVFEEIRGGGPVWDVESGGTACVLVADCQWPQSRPRLKPETHEADL